MENLNKTVSLILGVIVVIIFIVILFGRFNIQNKFLSLFKSRPASASVTPTKTQAEPSEDESTEPTPTTMGDAQVEPTVKPKQATTIPSTGAFTTIVPFILLLFVTGIALRRISDKR